LEFNVPFQHKYGYIRDCGPGKSCLNFESDREHILEIVSLPVGQQSIVIRKANKISTGDAAASACIFLP